MAVTRAFANVLADDLPATRDFYVALLDLEVAFDSDWFVNLNSGQREPGAGSPGCELGIWRRDHELIPVEFQRPPAGTPVEPSAEFAASLLQDGATIRQQFG